MISFASQDIYFLRTSSECYIQLIWKKNIFATTFPINLIEFGQNEILLVSHYNRSEAGLASVQTGNKCLYLYFIIEGKKGED